MPGCLVVAAYISPYRLNLRDSVTKKDTQKIKTVYVYQRAFKYEKIFYLLFNTVIFPFGHRCNCHATLENTTSCTQYHGGDVATIGLKEKRICITDITD